MLHIKLEEFLAAIQTLPSHRPLTKQDLLTEQFLIEREGELDMYYAPHNEYINKEAKIIIVGITPGWNQMKTAFEQLLKSLDTQPRQDIEQILKEVKMAASFSGTLRNNLIEMLDKCGIPDAVHLNSSSSFFKENRHLIHTTSIIKYPVFNQGKNYTGYQPSIGQSSLLISYAYKLFPEELSKIQQPALIIPLGKTVELTICKLLKKGKLQKHTFLFGFPHPSGANGHRRKQFQQQKDRLITTVRTWSKKTGL